MAIVGRRGVGTNMDHRPRACHEALQREACIQELTRPDERWRGGGTGGRDGREGILRERLEESAPFFDVVSLGVGACHALSCLIYLFWLSLFEIGWKNEEEEEEEGDGGPYSFGG